MAWCCRIGNRGTVSAGPGDGWPPGRDPARRLRRAGGARYALPKSRLEWCEIMTDASSFDKRPDWGDKRPEAAKRWRRGAQPLAEISGDVIDPILRRKAGMTTGLVAAWAGIVGARLAETTRPEKLQWPRDRASGEPFEPATLVVAAEPRAALRLQHQTTEILSRVNGFFGFHAVAKIRFVQKPVAVPKRDLRPKTRALDADEKDKVAGMIARIEDPKLKAALEAFALSTLSRLPGK